MLQTVNFLFHLPIYPIPTKRKNTLKHLIYIILGFFHGFVCFQKWNNTHHCLMQQALFPSYSITDIFPRYIDLPHSFDGSIGFSYSIDNLLKPG